MIRRFDDVGDEVRCALGACNVTGAVTMAALVNMVGETGFDALISVNPPTNTYIEGGYMLQLRSSASGYSIRLYNGFDENGNMDEADRYVEGDWALAVATKIAGAAAPRLHFYLFESETWIHADADTILNDASDCAGGDVILGAAAYAGEITEETGGDMAAAALWDRAMTDEEVEQLIAGDIVNGWGATEPVGLWTFDQVLPKEEVVDLAGNGADQTSIAGTTAIGKSPPIPYIAAPATSGPLLEPVGPIPTVPKLQIPLRMGRTGLAVLEQDSPEEITQSVYALLATERGSRLGDPDYGVEDASFEVFPLDDAIDEWLIQIANYEPRARVRTAAELDDLVTRVNVRVGGAS